MTTDGPQFVSVVVPSYNPKGDIVDCLRSIENQRTDVPYEVIVVDSSPWDVKGWLAPDFPDVRIVRLARRALPGKARSVGVEQAKGTIVFFTDADCVTDPSWINSLLEHHRAGYKAVGGSVANGTPGSAVGTAEYLLEFNEMNPGVRSREVKALPSCNLSVQRDLFIRLGGFPDVLTGEDTMFCDRVVSSGEKIFFENEAVITHRNRTGFNAFIRNQISLGAGSNETRRQTRRHGHFLVRHPLLVVGIPLGRTFLIGRRLLGSSRRLFLSFLVLYPLVFLGLNAYTWGFIMGLRRKKRSPGT